MKKTKKMNVVLAMVLSMTLLFGATISANAAEASVLFTVEQTNVNTAVTVPGQIPIIFNADGSNTYPTNWIIYNKSEIAGVHLVTADLKVRDGGWELLNESEDITKMSHDTKAIRFYMSVPNKLRNFKPSADDFSRLSFEDSYDSGSGIVCNGLLPGDLIFYSYCHNGRYKNISHVAIYVGEGKVVEAKNESVGVVYGDVPSPASIVLVGRP